MYRIRARKLQRFFSIKHDRSSIFLLITCIYILSLFALSDLSKFRILTKSSTTIHTSRDSKEPLTNIVQVPRNVLNLSAAAAYPSSFQRYINWHASMTKCLYNNSCTFESPNILIWRCIDGMSSLCWGTGDRLRGIISSLVLAMVTKRLFYIDWPNQPFQLHSVIAPSLIDWRLPNGLEPYRLPVVNDHKWPWLVWEKCPTGVICSIFSKPHANYSSVFSIIPRRMNLSETATYAQLDKIPMVVVYSRSMNSLRGRLLYRPEWKSKYADFRPGGLSQFEINRILIKALFQPSDRIRFFLREIIPDVAYDEGYISMHVRTGHDVGERDIARFSNLPENVSLIANRFLDCAENSGLLPHGHIYFASDSSPLKQAVSELSRRRTFNIYSTKEPAFHVASEAREASLKSTNLSPNAFDTVFVDFFALAGGKRMIASQSEFSRLAFLMSDGTNTIRFNATCGSCKCS